MASLSGGYNTIGERRIKEKCKEQNWKNQINWQILRKKIYFIYYIWLKSEVLQDY